MCSSSCCPMSLWLGVSYARIKTCFQHRAHVNTADQTQRDEELKRDNGDDDKDDDNRRKPLQMLRRLCQQTGTLDLKSPGLRWLRVTTYCTATELQYPGRNSRVWHVVPEQNTKAGRGVSQPAAVALKQMCSALCSHFAPPFGVNYGNVLIVWQIISRVPPAFALLFLSVTRNVLYNVVDVLGRRFTLAGRSEQRALEVMRTYRSHLVYILLPM